jgi:hypothetical protein
MNNHIDFCRKVKYLIKHHPAFAGMSGRDVRAHRLVHSSATPEAISNTITAR